MASSKLIDIGVKLGKQLGANTNKFLGTRSNINFLGKGPDEGKLFQQDINTEVLGGIELKSALPEIETSLGYLTAGKLNDIQANKLIDNLTKMNDFYYPITGDSIANVTDMASRTGGLTKGGLESLRGLGLKNFDNIKNRKIDPASSPLMSKIEDRVGGLLDDIGMNPEAIDASIAKDKASAIMKTIPKNEVPGKTASAREFLLNALKDENVNRTVFRDVVTPQDLKAITEGGGGVDMDPIVLVQKYFGPRVAELLPSNATVEEVSIFTQRILNNATDAKGLRPTDPEFDKFTLKLTDDVDDVPFADGGRAGYFLGGNIEGGYSESRKDSGGEQTTTRYGDNDGNSNTPPVITNSGGITEEVPVSKRTQYGFNFRNIFPGGKPFYGPINEDGENDEENKTINNINTGILGPLTLEAANTLKSRNDLNASTFKELNLADGGRASYRVGGITKALLKKLNPKKIKAAVDDIFPSGDYKYDAEMAAESLVEMNPKLFGGQLYDDLDDMVRSDVYGLVLKELSQRNALKMQTTRAARSQGTVADAAERPLFDKNGNLNKDAVLATASKYDGLDGKFAPRGFSLNVEKAMSELNIPREEAERIARLSSDEQKAALQIYMDRNTAQGVQLMNYNPKKFDAAKGGLAKILEI